MGRVVGIDLGTTNSVLAVVDAGVARVVQNSEGYALTPSVVAYLESHEMLVGQAARNQAILKPERTIYSAKRLIGRRYADVKEELRYLPYAVVEGEGGSARILIEERQVSPEEVAALVLKKLVEDASDRLGEQVTDAVITVPAYFDDAQRQATKNAGELAGLNVIRIVNEPTAAALAFSGGRAASEKIVVLDLGGGTFDVTVLDAAGSICEVLSTAGDTHLGGDDFTEKLYDLVLSRTSADIQEITRSSLSHKQRLFEACEILKCELSSVTRGSIELPFYLQTGSGPKHLQIPVTREDFELACAPLFERCVEPFQRALRDAAIDSDQLGQVLLVGGASRMPRLRSLVRELSGKEPNASLNPDESVALGAALQSAILTGQIDEFVLLDVVPFSLGVVTAGDRCEVVIPRNSSVPIRLSKFFSTAENFQRGADVIIVQGESRLASQNRELGRFAIEGLRSRVKGDAQLEIVFDIDENSILTVKAMDLEGGRESDLVIHGTTSLTREELEGIKRSLSSLRALE